MATTTSRATAQVKTEAQVTTGPAAAAFFAAGVGSFVLGLMIVLTEALPAFKSAVAFNAGVGPLSGKVIFAVVAYFLTWLIFGYLWRNKDVNLKRWVWISAGLVGLGFLGTFPIFFEMFTRS